MTLADLISNARARSVDTAVPYFVSDAQWTAFANDAEREACRRARLIVDSTTPEICQLALTAGTQTYALDPRIIFIRRVRVLTVPRPLTRASYKDLDQRGADWEDETGEPCAFVPDIGTAVFRPYPTPSADYTAKLTVVRTPLVDMVDDIDTPEINPRFHDSLIYWMLFRFYSIDDSELNDPKKAAENEALFEQEFGKKSTAIDEEWVEREYGYTGTEEGVF